MNNLQFLLAGIECKADHSITCMNPTEWFTPTEIQSEYKDMSSTDRIVWIRGEHTCWFRLDQVEIRNKIELPDDAELNSWLETATELRNYNAFHRPCSDVIKNAPNLLENAYLFASKIVKELK
jgi:hypothetical protein